MAFKDYFKVLSTEKKGDIDYVILLNKELIKINEYPTLMNVGNWNEYGKLGYRVVCRLEKEELEKLIISQIHINKVDFKIQRTVEFCQIC